MKKHFLSTTGRCSVFLLGLVGLASTAQAQSNFGSAVTYSTGGTSSLGLAVGDVTGDGRLDIVTANQGTDNVSILRGSATSPGTFSPAVTYASGGSRPTGVALGDLNGDGRLDIVAVNQTAGTVGVLLNAAASPGTFSTAVTYSSGGSTPNIPALSDLNGDGRLDIVVANTNAATVAVLLGSATVAGTFGQAVTYAVAGTSPVGVTIGDVTGDGRADIITGSNSLVTGSNNVVSVLSGSATVAGTFNAAVGYSSGGTGTIGVALGDINNDGRTDILATNSTNNNVGVLLGVAGATSFAPAVTYPSGGIGPNFALLGDMNGDGRLDIVAGNNTSSTVSVLTALPTVPGTFAAAVAYPSGGNGAISLALGDLNGDGRRDIVTTNYTSGTVGVLLNTYMLAALPAQLADRIAPYPNPSHEAFAVEIPAIAGVNVVNAELFNTLGQVVHRQQAALPGSGTRLVVATAGLAPGVYTLRLRAGNTALARRVVVQ